ncbi:hypothetical protein M406DRAFT_288155 [Cryphonectria parasitica EP155]|uniref:Uncharacterized protein n=1 Tax=Cryphonectria parasitica (strain ATCC 38755 / EP155) TaxID=660469 RepID=A0A9P4Y5A8_CRYP1|nr:uncharacterized protein M406DRAFT_288155 [Cryphonectria parasitica EP155]KAF3767197.1 hypothetical protein M406DRAFT_288155 [Cryphonectria parasitica EP155]
MAATTLLGLLDSLTQSLSSTFEASVKIPSVESPKDGISLLDVKNELLLAYLQNLVFLILVKLRKGKLHDAADSDNRSSIDDGVVKKLVELRLYLEKGVRPLEDKLRYQIEKVLRAADDAARNEKAAQAAADSDHGSKSGTGSDEDSDEDDEDDKDDGESGPNVADLAFRPSMSAVSRSTIQAAAKSKKDANGIYRPPKVAPTAMPTTERRETRERGPIKSATMDEFVADEMSSAPLAQPSIGTNIVQFGRRMKTASERKEEDERRDYEERNFVRLPLANKKDRAKAAAVESRRGRMNYGGEEFRDLSMGVDRINRLTKKKDGGSGTRALLEKSRKRGPETVDGPRGSGDNMGDRYQKRLKVLDSGRRDRGKGRRS